MSTRQLLELSELDNEDAFYAALDREQAKQAKARKVKEGDWK